MPRPTRLGFLLVPGFALMSYAAIAEPFRAANVLSGAALYESKVYSSGAPVVAASNGAAIAVDGPLPGADALDFLFVCAGGNPTLHEDPATLAGLRRLARQGGVRIGGISAGAWLLARAGLLDGYRCTIHWEHRPAFIEAFPDLEVENGLYIVDRDRLTCAGGVAGLDLAIALIAAEHGEDLARTVGEWYIRANPRDGDAAQRAALRDRYGVSNERLLVALALMESQVEDPIGRQELARRSGVSVRQLGRLARDQLGETLSRTYLKIRLDRASALLRETGLSMTVISTACGFASVSHFSRSFRLRYGQPPTATRLRSGKSQLEHSPRQANAA
jgi:transcriptional regulator GlxA family with amidase domain